MNERAALERCGSRRANVALLNTIEEGRKEGIMSEFKNRYIGEVLSHMNKTTAKKESRRFK